MEMQDEMEANLIILDNGHGVETPGKCSPVWPDGSQLREYEFNRDIVARIKHYFKDNGKVKILVPEQYDVPLSTRCKRVNDIVRCNIKKTVLLLSIHANAGGGTGWEAWTSKGETKSDLFATLLYNSAAKFFTGTGFPLRKDTTDGDVDKEEQFYILKNTNCPAVLSENLFMDTEKDCKFLMSEEGRQAIANIHIDFIKLVLR